MYPALFWFGEFKVTSLGVMVGIGALAGVWLLRRELRAGIACKQPGNQSLVERRAQRS